MDCQISGPFSGAYGRGRGKLNFAEFRCQLRRHGVLTHRPNLLRGMSRCVISAVIEPTGYYNIKTTGEIGTTSQETGYLRAPSQVVINA
jgi:hypothetical protein